MYRPQLKTFLTVCETGSFSKAAEALFITPSAVLQQIRSLEADLGVPLFLRSTKGVSLTPAGEYLSRRGADFVQMSEEMRRDLHSIASVDKRICVGTSIMEKVRLLYELWVLYSEQEKDCEIQMINIEMGHNIPAEVELIESVNSGVAWMREWEFLEICRVPFGFAVVKDHPLAARSLLRLEDLRHETVVTLNDGSCDAVADLLELLKRNYISVQNPSLQGANLLWESAFRRDALLVPMCWSDILINMTVLPFEQEFLLPYGIFYRAQTHPAVSRFLDFIKQTYREGNARGIVPVLS